MKDNPAWSQLKKIDVEKEKMVKQKGKYSYISWAMAWSKLCDIYPDATFEKHCNEQGFPYLKDENGWCFTKVTVIVNGKSITEMLPVLNNYNKPIKNPDSAMMFSILNEEPDTTMLFDVHNASTLNNVFDGFRSR